MYLLIFDQNLGIFASHVDGQQKLSKQRRLVIRQDGQDHSFCHIGQHSSPGNRNEILVAGLEPIQSLTNMTLLLQRLMWLLPWLTL